MAITTRQYRILADHREIYHFMTEIYARDWRNGVPAPFLEYALSSSWMDKSFTHRNRIWLEDARIVGFCFTESPVTDIYFSLRPGYEFLAEEMIAYAGTGMPGAPDTRQLVLFGGQTALIAAAEKAGYERSGGHMDLIYDFEKPLIAPLPQGFRFVDPGRMRPEGISLCCWKGFDHEAEEGPWDGDAENCYHLMQAPHATPQHAVAIENERGEYVCYAGMWWTPENQLAYMEPLCTIPEYRRKGLAAAALSEMYRRTKALGATHMTGGSNAFYASIGYQPMIAWTFWKKESER